MDGLQNSECDEEEKEKTAVCARWLPSLGIVAQLIYSRAFLKGPQDAIRTHSPVAKPN
jgi:hypothetical protein